MQRNKDYSFLELEQIARDNNYEFKEIGEDAIIGCGKTFIVLEHNEKDITVSFVLTGYNGNGGVFTCIYSDLELT